MSLEYRLYEI